MEARFAHRRLVLGVDEVLGDRGDQQPAER
jgi:hypothetical protein